MNTNLQTLISLQQTSEATSAMQYPRRSNVTLSGSSATLASSSPATWSLNSPSPATGTGHDHQFKRSDRLYRHHVAELRHPDL